VDGVQFDDYFYPYPIKEAGHTVDFPDLHMEKIRPAQRYARDDGGANVNQLSRSL